HDAQFSKGRIFRIVAHKLNTAIELKEGINLLHESAVKFFEGLGEDPYYYLQRLKFDNRNEYSFADNKSAVIVDTASGAGVGQSYRSDDLYLTEYSDWANAENSYNGLIGSMPLDHPFTRITIDFNAHGIGNDAYRKFQAAKRGENGYTKCFYGVLDCPEIYPPEKLAQKKLDLGRQYGAVFPATEDEMWIWDDEAVFDYGDIQDCARDVYYRDRPLKKSVEYFHGVDTATGQKDGDWQVMKGFALVDGKLVEAYPPIRVREPEDVFARRVDKYARLFKGTVVVERNVGGAVITVLKEKGTPGLFRHKSRDKTGGEKRQIGFPMTYPAKRTMISEFSQMLRRREIELVSENGREELRIFEWKQDT
ncbi:MAG: hypothetical protein KAT00_15535, partial [Planctomycetes bacterium]|nr:hypothetical protein [Planctomycetota bacterium]